MRRFSISCSFVLIIAACAAPRARTETTVAQPVAATPAPDSVARWARALDAPRTRADALAELRARHDRALDAAGGDHDAEAVRAVVDGAADPLARAYRATDDPVLGESILELLVDMRTPRAWPAFEAALDWRPDLTETHAGLAARALAEQDSSEIPASVRARALAAALLRIEGDRGVDNHMRIWMIRALGRADDAASLEALHRVMASEDPRQSFLINRMAAQQLVELASPQSVPHLVLALFRFPEGRPDMRMNDVAAEALLHIGRPALEPALALLRGESSGANAIAVDHVEAIRRIDPSIAARMSASEEVRTQASLLLGMLGLPEALEPLLSEAQRPEDGARLSAAVALVGLSGLGEADRERIRRTIERVYGQISDPRLRHSVLGAVERTHDPRYVSFSSAIALDPDADLALRSSALAAATALATGADAERLLRVMERETELREPLVEQRAALEATVRCDRDDACWRALLDADDPRVARKAAQMLAQLGVREAPAMQALLAQLPHPDVTVRLAVLEAIDRLCPNGCEAAIDAIDALGDAEEGRSSWNAIRAGAMAVRGRQRLRLQEREESERGL